MIFLGNIDLFIKDDQRESDTLFKYLLFDSLQIKLLTETESGKKGNSPSVGYYYYRFHRTSFSHTDFISIHLTYVVATE